MRSPLPFSRTARLTLATLTLCGLSAGLAAPAVALSPSGPWVLTDLTVAGRMVPLPAQAPTLTFGTPGVTGDSGCNTYRAAVTQRGAALRFGLLAVTRRACTDVAPQTLEAQYLNTLQRVTHFQFKGGALTLLGASGTRLVYRKEVKMTAPTPALQGQWTVTQLTLNGQPAPLVAPAHLTFTPAQNGAWQLTGTTGCNQLTATVQVQGHTLTFGPLGTTRQLCDAPRNAQEQAVLKLLGVPLSATPGREGEALQLRGAAGELLLRRAPAAGSTPPTPAPRPSLDGAFVLERVNGQAVPAGAPRVSLTLNGDRLGGSDGCNSFGGEFKFSDGTLKLTGPLTSTLRACPEEGQTVSLTALLTEQPRLTLTASGLQLRSGDLTLEFRRN